MSFAFYFLSCFQSRVGGHCNSGRSRTSLWGSMGESYSISISDVATTRPLDWDFIRGYVHPSSLLNGYLPRNNGEYKKFLSVWTHYSCELLINEIFQHKTAAYNDWSKDDLLCRSCLVQFLRVHIPIWYVHRQRSRESVVTLDVHAPDITIPTMQMAFTSLMKIVGMVTIVVLKLTDVNMLRN